VPTIVPTSSNVWSAVVQAAGTCWMSEKGTFFSVAGASPAVMLREGPKT